MPKLPTQQHSDTPRRVPFQHLDSSLYEAGIMLTYWQTAIYLGSGEVPGAMGSAHPLMAPYQARNPLPSALRSCLALTFSGPSVLYTQRKDAASSTLHSSLLSEAAVTLKPGLL